MEYIKDCLHTFLKSLIGQFIVTLVLVIVMFAFMLIISLLSLI